MAFLGKGPTYGSFEKQSLVVDGILTTFNLRHSISSASSILVSVGGVIQEPTVAYWLGNGGKQIIFSEPPVANTYIVFLGKQYLVPVPSTESVTRESLIPELQNSVGSWEIVSTNTIATSGKWYMVDTFAGSVSITLPATPGLGDTFKIMDYSGTFDTNTCTLLRNTQKIEGLASDLVLNISKSDIEIRYTGTTFGWRLVG